jgi:RNA ligase
MRRRQIVKLWDLMDMDLYRQMVREKYIRVNEFTLEVSYLHKKTFRILGYTEKAQFDNLWNEVTKQCRGLVIDENWNVLARPFDKFMNLSEDDKQLMDEPVHVSDKMDGSLGILFCYNQQFPEDRWHDPTPVRSVPAVYYAPWEPKWTLITRGSYDSDQAVMGRKLAEQHTGLLDPNWTYMVEIIYPENRIVVNYGDRKGLTWLGARNLSTGLVRLSPSQYEWYGEQTKVFPYKTLREALECPPRANAEGYVVYFPNLDYRIKVKQDDYVALHRVVTGLTKRRVWENMKDGKTLADLLEIVPDEWHPWLQETYKELQDHYDRKVFILKTLFYDGIVSSLPRDFTRKDFALAVKDANLTHPGIMFLLLDGKDISSTIWDIIKPTAE